MKKRIAACLSAFLLCGLCAGCGGNAEKAYSVDDYRTTMNFRDGFKILQLADLHLGIESDLKKQLNLVTDTI